MSVPHEHIMQFFSMVPELTPQLKALCEVFEDVARKLENGLPANPERTVALRKLLESRDCAVRAALVSPVRARRE
jgi:hypothetical protein